MNINSPSWFDALIGWVGALPAQRVTWGLVLFFAVWVPLDVFIFKITGSLSNSSFDAMMRARIVVAAPDPRLVIVDIDEASLARMGREFGRWPWPRDTLATVLDYIEQQQPNAIVWDILFSDVDRMSPGGDAAFNEGARRSLHSHFSTVRLPQSNDAASQINRSVLPGLWIAGVPVQGILRRPTKVSSVALIPPILPAVANGRLGFNNGYVDADGILRRYRHLEPLPDGSAIQSIALSVLGTLNSVAYKERLTSAAGLLKPKDELITWRKNADAYPRYSFADVFARAEGDKPSAQAQSFTGKVVIVGATAPSLYDIHPTPLSPMQAGVDVLATVIDNALNRRQLAEMPRWIQATLAIALCAVLALRVQFKSVGSLQPYLLVLPLALLGISYFSLNVLPVFLDLHLAAGLTLVFLSVLHYWNKLRRIYWCSPPPPHASQPLAIWPWERGSPWLDGALDSLIDALERHAPSCRVVVCDSTVNWPSTLRWPELARFAAVVGPQDALEAARAQLEPTLKRLARRCGEPISLHVHPSRELLAQSVFMAWAKLHNIETDTD